MSVDSLCEICGTGTVEDGCDRCGRLVCAEHFDESMGMCTDCLAEFGEQPTENDRGEYPDGVEEYRF